MFLLKGGRLAEPYVASANDMMRDDVIEVERIKIMEGPNRGLEGWAQSNCLGRLGSLYAL